ncbi:hypothetical protein GLOIN_2v1486447 [Rhizophagus clarus]|uniref:Hsp70 family protein n=1 Tax=Rhizophagus clarus TaxID=94130 RepID=A0A8H3M0Q6_9GLOM|nr:hypothetical protein GLOIN_2v1486447 [Rhizophagus clarus]
MNLLEKFEKLNNKLTNLLEENKEIKQHYKNLQEEYQELKEKLDERDYKNLQEENKELKLRLEERNKQCQQHILNLKKQKNEQLELKRQYKSLREENKKLRENLNEKENQFQQHVRNLEKQKNEQLEIFSKNLEKTLEKFELDELNEVNENDIKNLEVKTKFTISPLIDDDIKDKEFIQSIEDSSGSVLFPSKDKGNQTHRSGYLHSENKLLRNCSDIRVVVGLDFGTTYSGFSFCYVTNPKEIITNDQWFGEFISFKTNTVLQYDENNEVKSWGLPALTEKPGRRKSSSNKIRVELFKLHLGKLPDNLKPHLPDGLNYKKTIIDYLREIGEVIKNRIGQHWPTIDFFKQVLLVLTVPAEYSNKEIALMRDCVYNAGLIEKKCSKNLQFTTEPEAVAIYCLNDMENDEILTIGCSKFYGELGEITERTGDFCGSTYIDKEFINFLRKKLGNDAIKQLMENHYGQFQYMVQNFFCQKVKLPFTGNREDYDTYELDIERVAPILITYVGKEIREIMEENEWIIDIRFEDIKAMFDPVIDRIIGLIRSQLSNVQDCSAIFLAGGFSESEYLQKRIKQEFQHVVKNIRVSTIPIAAISRGAVMYGLSLKNDNVISTRILKYTYGIEVVNYWMEGDPISRRLHNGRIVRFHCLARRGTQVETNQKASLIGYYLGLPLDKWR